MDQTVSFMDCSIGDCAEYQISMSRTSISNTSIPLNNRIVNTSEGDVLFTRRAIKTGVPGSRKETVENVKWMVTDMYQRAITADISKKRFRGFTKLNIGQESERSGEPSDQFKKYWVKTNNHKPNFQYLYKRFAMRAVKTCKEEELGKIKQDKRCQERKLFLFANRQARLRNIRSIGRLIELELSENQLKVDKALDVIKDFKKEFMQDCPHDSL